MGMRPRQPLQRGVKGKEGTLAWEAEDLSSQAGCRTLNKAQPSLILTLQLGEEGLAL